MSTPITLEQLFGAFVNQGTIEEAAAWMSGLAISHPDLSIEFDDVLRRSIEAAGQGERWVIEAVNLSGYRVQSASEARELCVDLLNAYEALCGGNA